MEQHSKREDDQDQAEASSSSGSTQDRPEIDKPDSAKSDGLFECNICLDSPSDPVISFCGHLFCWPCLHGWLSMREQGEQTCPVCKSAVDRDKVVPLYGRNSKQEDPRNKTVPPRPQGRRTEPTGNQNFVPEFMPFPGFGFGNAGFHMTVGFGSLPLNLLLTALNFGINRNGAQQDPQGVMSKLLLWFAIILIFFVIFF